MLCAKKNPKTFLWIEIFIFYILNLYLCFCTHIVATECTQIVHLFKHSSIYAIARTQLTAPVDGDRPGGTSCHHMYI